jgi:hypothetical protein
MRMRHGQGGACGTSAGCPFGPAIGSLGILPLENARRHRKAPHQLPLKHKAKDKSSLTLSVRCVTFLGPSRFCCGGANFWWSSVTERLPTAEIPCWHRGHLAHLAHHRHGKGDPDSSEAWFACQCSTVPAVDHHWADAFADTPCSDPNIRGELSSGAKAPG